MSWRRRVQIAAVAALWATAGLAAQPSPDAAHADPICDVTTAPADAVTGGIEAVTGGGVSVGNPLGDACDAVTGAVGGAVTDPIKDAVKGVGEDVFKQLTAWVAEGTGWLMGEVVVAIEETTTPQVASKSFLSQYMKMAAIGAVMALAMLMLAVLEGLAQGNSMMLLRVAFVNAPLALIATTVAFAVVQMLLVITDGLCSVVSASSNNGSERFFEAAIKGLAETGGGAGKSVGEATGGPAGGAVGQAQGAVAAPLFVSFLGAIVGAFAAFFVWLELLMRDAAVYVVSLFLPLSLAASIWPRWSGALRRTAELLIAIIGSKFVIVAIIGLAAALVSNGDGGIEHVLAAGALMLLACFAPFVLLKLIPFAEGAMGAAYARRSASGGAVSGMQMASDVAILRGLAKSRGDDSGVTLWSSEGGAAGGASSPGKGRGDGRGGGPGGGGGSGPGVRGGGGGGSSGGASGAAAGGGAAAGAGAAAAVPAAAVRGAKGTAGRLSQTAAGGQSAGGAKGGSGGAQEAPDNRGAAGAGGGEPSAGERPPRPKPHSTGKPSGGEGQ